MRRGGWAGCFGVATASPSRLPAQERGTNVVNGKTLFVEKCGACHMLARAGATGDDRSEPGRRVPAVAQDGLGESTFEGVVHQQILHPNRNPQLNPQTGETTPQMPANLVTGQDARNVAAYVAQAAAVPGEDEGRLAGVGASQAEGTADGGERRAGHPGRRLRSRLQVRRRRGRGRQRQVHVREPADAPTHDIAVEGNGVNDKGEIVTNGGVSEFTADLQPGEYTFFCSVPGHREGGMEGKLTVK